VVVAHTERPGPKLKNKLFAVAAASGLILFLAGLTPAHNEEKTPKPGEKVERSLAVDPQVTITLCVASGVLTVHGWDKREVRVASTDADQLEFRRIDKSKDPQTPASRVDVMVLDKAARANPKMDCQAIADVDMHVPVGATVQVQTRDGDISISGVAGAYAGSQNGDIRIEHATKLVEAGSVGGSISIRDSSGRINLSSAGGGVEATNIRADSPDDTFEVGTVSGDIQLEGIATPRVMAKTVSGTLNMSGALVKSGYYSFTNVTGEIVLAMPSDASFRLNAKVSDKQDIDSEFPLKYLSEPAAPPQVLPPAPKPPEAREPKLPEKEKEALKEKEKMAIKTAPPAKAPAMPKPGPVVGPITVERPMIMVPYVRRIEAICGSGDALILVASFGGSVHLKKL
jgi:Putative adhesin